MKNFKLFIESNITLSLAAAFLSAGSALQMGMMPQSKPFLVLIFFGTFLAYNVNQIFGLILNKHTTHVGYSKWVRSNKVLFFIMVCFAMVGLVWSGLFVKPEVQVSLLGSAVISVLYSLPVVQHKGRRYTLRDVPYLKIFMITIVWSVATVMLPAIQLGVPLFSAPVLLLFAERILFLFALAILFDIRDMEKDERTNLKTIPLLIGKSKAFITANLLLFLVLVISLFHYTDSLTFVIPALAISVLTTILFIMYSKIKTMSHFHYRIFDGTLLFQPILVFVFYYFDKTL